MSERRQGAKSENGAGVNDNGASTCDRKLTDYGRRVETDSSWTVYDVFTGSPALVEGVTMTGLSHSHATESMLSLNRCNVRRRKARKVRREAAPLGAEIARPPCP